MADGDEKQLEEFINLFMEDRDSESNENGHDVDQEEILSVDQCSDSE
jgi:hypothetical protein